MSKKLRIVVLCVGRMGKNHLRLTSESSDFELVAVADPVFKGPVKAGVQLVTAPAELKGLDFDAAIVATPTATPATVSAKRARS